MNAENLVWMDLEMTGLEPDQDVIIEIATVVTDGQLNIIAEGPSLIIHQSDHTMDNMNDWCKKYHGDSGLTQRVKDSKVSLKEAEQLTLNFIRKHVLDGVAPLCGNSIHQDRRFLVKYMPRLEAWFHYRNVDVSTVKEMVKRWYPEQPTWKKQGAHLALDDVLESIEELKHYRKTNFKPWEANL
ncbi:MAG: oligoribonuclease [Ghiorsea sp.]